MDTFPIAKLATLIFMMMGPIGLIPAFAGLTAGADTAQRRRIALHAFGYACVALSIAVAIGAGVLAAWGASRPALVIAAGLLLAFASLRNVLAPPRAPRAPGGSARTAKPPPPSPGIALSPIAFPSIVTPHGVGVLIVFVAYAPEASVKASILGVGLAIMALDLFATLGAQRLMRAIGLVPLTLLGAVFGVLQLALGVEMIASGIALRAAGGG
jgi:multiple antibiotic resistance protein